MFDLSVIKKDGEYHDNVIGTSSENKFFGLGDTESESENFDAFSSIIFPNYDLMRTSLKTAEGSSHN